MKIKKLLILPIILFITLLTTGCTQDNMDNIEAIVTNYPNEYILKQLYDEHANIESIYPDGVDINAYKLNKKQIEDFSKKDLFIYNGLIEKERDLALDLLSLNPDLKIIDTAYVLETDYSPEELWLNPSSLLMMAQNVRLGLKEYINSSYLKKSVDSKYESLKITLSELDANYRVSVENSKYKKIVVSNPALKYLEKFGLEVYCIDEKATDKTVSDIETLIKEDKIKYIYSFKNEEQNKKIKKLLDENKQIKLEKLHKIDNITDKERLNKTNYITLMNNNFDLLKKELYK